MENKILSPRTEEAPPASENIGTGGFSSLIDGCSEPRKSHPSLEVVSPLSEKDPLGKEEASAEGGLARRKAVRRTSNSSLSIFGVKLCIINVTYDPGEPAIWSPIDRAHPGRGPSVAYDAIYAMRGEETFPIDLTEVLSKTVIDSIEATLISQYEN